MGGVDPERITNASAGNFTDVAGVVGVLLRRGAKFRVRRADVQGLLKMMLHLLQML